MNTADVFVKFRDDQGNFASDDVNALVMLHDAAHLRTRGEEALDSAVTFTKIRLQSVMDSLAGAGRRGAVHTGDASVQEGSESGSKALPLGVRAERSLEFAKVDYTILHAQYCDELRSLTM